MAIETKILLGVLAVAAAYLAAGCGDKLNPVGPPSTDDLPEIVTYTEHVKPIADPDCANCHATYRTGAERFGAPPGCDCDTYEALVACAVESNATIQSGSMPPGGWPDYNRRLFQKWLDQGLLR